MHFTYVISKCATCLFYVTATYILLIYLQLIWLKLDIIHPVYRLIKLNAVSMICRLNKFQPRGQPFNIISACRLEVISISPILIKVCRLSYVVPYPYYGIWNALSRTFFFVIWISTYKNLNSLSAFVDGHTCTADQVSIG